MAAKRAKPSTTIVKAALAATRKPKAPGGSAAKGKAPNPTAGAKRAAKPKAKRAALVNEDVARAEFAALRTQHPDAHCELDHKNPFQLIIATVLSAQSTDVMVNKITPDIFKRWGTPQALAEADPAEVEQALSRIGMFRQKTRNIIGLSKLLVSEHGGKVPRTLAELVKLPGVGRKTANVVLGVAFGQPEGVVVDTHVQRLSQRLGFTRHQDPLEIEQDLMRIFPKSDWDMLSHTLIFHGRRVCSARKPACSACSANTDCPSAFNAELVGRKPARLRA